MERAASEEQLGRLDAEAQDKQATSADSATSSLSEVGAERSSSSATPETLPGLLRGAADGPSTSTELATPPTTKAPTEEEMEHEVGCDDQDATSPPLVVEYKPERDIKGKLKTESPTEELLDHELASSARSRRTSRARVGPEAETEAIVDTGEGAETGVAVRDGGVATGAAAVPLAPSRNLAPAPDPRTVFKKEEPRSVSPLLSQTQSWLSSSFISRTISSTFTSITATFSRPITPPQPPQPTPLAVSKGGAVEVPHLLLRTNSREDAIETDLEVVQTLQSGDALILSHFDFTAEQLGQLTPRRVRSLISRWENLIDMARAAGDRESIGNSVMSPASIFARSTSPERRGLLRSLRMEASPTRSPI